METDIDKRAETQWTKSDVSYTNYQEYIKNKGNRFVLTIIDLFYISNFKGGNSTFNEPTEIINEKLKGYSQELSALDQNFQNISLAMLSDEKIELLIAKVKSICLLTHKNSKYKVDGFGVSYLSALLNSYFPNLLPILDRRILINLNIVSEADLDKQKQIKQIEDFYGDLIGKFANLMKETGWTIRSLDRKYFKKQLLPTGLQPSNAGHRGTEAG